MRPLSEWTTEQDPGSSASHLVHLPCGFRSHLAYDLSTHGPFGEAAALLLIVAHTCTPRD